MTGITDDLLNLQKGYKFKISGDVWKVMNVNIYVWKDKKTPLNMN